VTESDPTTSATEEPRGHVPAVPRPAFGFRQILIVTAVVTVAAAILVLFLYMSPLAAR
jgi:hypothetical protein